MSQKKLLYWRLFSVMASLSIILMGSLAQALPMNANRPLTSPGLNLDPNHSEDTLQEIFDKLYVSGAGIDAVNDQIGAALFTSTSSGGSVATFIIEIAGNGPQNQFGIYSANAPNNQAVIFDGVATNNSQALVSYLANGDIMVNGMKKASGFVSSFGFFLTGPGGTFFSEDEKNPNGAPQALIYQGNGLTDIQIGYYAPGPFAANEFIIAFEDLPYANSDKDFNDLVVMIESISPVPTPEPSTMLLLGTGLLAMAGYGWRRQKQMQ